MAPIDLTVDRTMKPIPNKLYFKSTDGLIYVGFIDIITVTEDSVAIELVEDLGVVLSRVTAVVDDIHENRER